jgi:hypothetical protein
VVETDGAVELTETGKAAKVKDPDEVEDPDEMK